MLRPWRSDWTRGPRSLFRVRRPAHPARRPVHRRRLRHCQNIRGEGRTVCTNHAWGVGLPWLRRSVRVSSSARVLHGRAGRETGHGSARVAGASNVYRKGSTLHPPARIAGGLLLAGDDRQAAAASTRRAKEQGRRASPRTRSRAAWAWRWACTAAAWTAPDASEVRRRTQPGRHGNRLQHLGRPRPGRGHGHSGGKAHEACVRWGSTPSRLRLVMNDTSQCPNSGPSGGSRQPGGHRQRHPRSAARMLIKGMKKSDGSYRTYDEMQAEKVCPPRCTAVGRLWGF